MLSVCMTAIPMVSHQTTIMLQSDDDCWLRMTTAWPGATPHPTITALANRRRSPDGRWFPRPSPNSAGAVRASRGPRSAHSIKHARDPSPTHQGAFTASNTHVSHCTVDRLTRATRRPLTEDVLGSEGAQLAELVVRVQQRDTPHRRHHHRVGAKVLLKSRRDITHVTAGRYTVPPSSRVGAKVLLRLGRNQTCYSRHSNCI